MTAVQEPLFTPGWDAEPCGDAGPVRATEVRRVFGDHGTSASRGRRYTDWLRPVDDVATGRWL
jgi:hypothetical protein